MLILGIWDKNVNMHVIVWLKKDKLNKSRPVFLHLKCQKIQHSLFFFIIIKHFLPSSQDAVTVQKRNSYRKFLGLFSQAFIKSVEKANI